MTRLELGDMVRVDATYTDVCDSLPDDLDTLAAETGHLHSLESECVGHIAARVVKAKSMCAHGEWTPWVRRNLPFGEREAQRYLKVAKALANATHVSHLSLRAALRAIAAEKRDDEKRAAEEEEAAIEASVTESTDPTIEPGSPVVEPDARTKIARLAQRLETAQAIVGAAVSEVEGLLSAAEGSERDWLADMLGWVRSANDDLVEFVELGMRGGE